MQIIINTTAPDQTLCYDDWTGRYFMSNADHLELVALRLDRERLNVGSVSLNRFYDETGLSTVVSGEDLGWSDMEIEIGFGAMVTPMRTTALSVWFTNAPVHVIGFR